MSKKDKDKTPKDSEDSKKDKATQDTESSLDLIPQELWDQIGAAILVETDPATPLIQAIRYYKAWSLVKDKDSLNRPRDRTYSGNQALICKFIFTTPCSHLLTRSELQRFQRRQTSGVTIVSESDLLENESRA